MECSTELVKKKGLLNFGSYLCVGISGSDAFVVVCLSNNHYCSMNKVKLSLSRMFI